jgi:hypothetical protein
MQNHSFISKPENQKLDECVICGRPKHEHREHIRVGHGVSPANPLAYSSVDGELLFNHRSEE